MTAPRERALELLERHIASARENGDDPEATARECLVALEGLGYRPTEAKPAADWRLRGTGGSDPSPSTAAALAAVRQQCAVSPTRVHSAEPPAGPPQPDPRAARA